MPVPQDDKELREFAFHIADSFLSQLELYMDEHQITRSELAKRADLTRGRISQIFKHPGNLTMRTMLRLVKSLQMRIAIVAYDSEAAVPSDLFRQCWYDCDRPTTAKDLDNGRSIVHAVASSRHT